MSIVEGKLHNSDSCWIQVVQNWGYRHHHPPDIYYDSTLNGLIYGPGALQRTGHCFCDTFFNLFPIILFISSYPANTIWAWGPGTCGKPGTSEADHQYICSSSKQLQISSNRQELAVRPLIIACLPSPDMARTLPPHRLPPKATGRSCFRRLSFCGRAGVK